MNNALTLIKSFDTAAKVLAPMRKALEDAANKAEAEAKKIPDVEEYAKLRHEYLNQFITDVEEFQKMRVRLERCLFLVADAFAFAEFDSNNTLPDEC